MVNIIKDYFITTYQELTKVHWLSRDILIKHTLIVLVAILVTMALAGGLDYVLMQIIEKIVLVNQ